MKICTLLLVLTSLLFLAACTGDGHSRSYILSQEEEPQDSEQLFNRR